MFGPLSTKIFFATKIPPPNQTGPLIQSNAFVNHHIRSRMVQGAADTIHLLQFPFLGQGTALGRQILNIPAEKIDPPRLAHGSSVLRREDRPAAGGDHLAAPGAGRLQNLTLQRTEGPLALLGEDFRYWFSCRPNDFFIQVDERFAG